MAISPYPRLVRRRILDPRVSALNFRVGALESNVAQLQSSVQRAYEGTALAIAMGGAYLLRPPPITAHSGTKTGLPPMVRVADFAYLNGAIGVGLDHGGIGGCGASPLPGRRAVPAPAVFRAAWFAFAFACLSPMPPLAAQQKPAAPKPPPQPAAPAPAPAPHPAQINRNGVLILIRSTLSALDQANKTGNYTVLRDLGAPGFQAANNAARLAEIFASERAQNLDLSGVLVLEPQLTLLPQVEANGMMRMAGFFPSVPAQVNFELAFMPVESRWRLFGISVNLGSSSPVAPEPERQDADQKAPPPPKPAPPPARK